MRAAWPQVAAEDSVLTRISQYLDKTLSEIRVVHGKSGKKKGGTPGRICLRVCCVGLDCNARKGRHQADAQGPPDAYLSSIHPSPVSSLVVLVAREYLEWQRETMLVLAEAAASGVELDKDFKKSLLTNARLEPWMRDHPLARRSLLPFAQFTLDEFELRGVEALELTLPFDEAEILDACESSLVDDLALTSFQVVAWPPSSELTSQVPSLAKLSPPTPGRPACVFY